MKTQPRPNKFDRATRFSAKKRRFLTTSPAGGGPGARNNGISGAIFDPLWFVVSLQVFESLLDLLQFPENGFLFLLHLFLLLLEEK